MQKVAWQVLRVDDNTQALSFFISAPVLLREPIKWPLWCEKNYNYKLSYKRSAEMLLIVQMDSSVWNSHNSSYRL